MVAMLVLFTILLFLTVDYLATRPARSRVTAASTITAGTESVATLVREAYEVVASPTVDDETYIAPGHVWVSQTPSGDVRVGVDGVLMTLLGKVECMYPHPEGSAVGRGGPLLMLRNGNRALKIRSPLDGVITRVNHRARGNPEILGSEDGQEGWIYELTPSRLTRALQSMKRGREAARWLRDELQRLRDLSVSLMSGEVGGYPVMADGGLFSDDLGALIEEHVDDRCWENLVAEFFLDSHLS